MYSSVLTPVTMTEESKDALSLTDDDENDDFEDESHLPEMAGTLNKWTNYIHGWQDRYIVLKDGTLSYYKSENETAFGCRGAVSLAKAIITGHDFDECRFDVSVNDCLWYLRARDAEERQQWIDILELHRQAESGYGSENSLRRHGSLMSLTSTTSLSTASASSFKRGRGLREKLAEMETFKDILCRQVDTLQSYFDACSSALAQHSIHDFENDDIGDPDDIGGVHHPRGTNASGESRNMFGMEVDGPREKDIINILQQHGAHAIDFKGEAFTFKATTTGILATLSHCVELMSQREEAWKKRLEKEMEKRKRVEELYKTLANERPKAVRLGLGGPDYEEGPHAMITEEEFFDAVDAGLDKLDKLDEERRVKKVSEITPSLPPKGITSLDPSHRLYNEISGIVSDHVKHADMTGKQIAQSWALVAEEGEMKIYKRDQIEDGMVVDPHKAVHAVKGITGHELCHYFWDTGVRLEWDTLIDSTKVVEWLSKDTIVSYQVHKRVWPATQRDSLFWSTIQHFPSEDGEGPDYWAVVNHTTDHPDAPSSAKCVRIRFNVAMICQTEVKPPQSGQEITRDHLTCRIQYSATVNPGGWAPASVIKLISKRELPKFIKTFTAYVQDKTKDKPIMF